jgi:hypothetical protein
MVEVRAAGRRSDFPAARIYGMTQIMHKSGERVVLKKRGRPATGNDPVRSFRMPDELMERIDTWSADEADEPSRAEAIRRLVELGLKAKREKL